MTWRDGVRSIATVNGLVIVANNESELKEAPRGWMPIPLDTLSITTWMTNALTPAF